MTSINTSLVFTGQFNHLSDNATQYFYVTFKVTGLESGNLRSVTWHRNVDDAADLVKEIGDIDTLVPHLDRHYDNIHNVPGYTDLYLGPGADADRADWALALGA